MSEAETEKIGKSRLSPNSVTYRLSMYVCVHECAHEHHSVCVSIQEAEDQLSNTYEPGSTLTTGVTTTLTPDMFVLKALTLQEKEKERVGLGI